MGVSIPTPACPTIVFWGTDYLTLSQNESFSTIGDLDEILVLALMLE